MRFHLVLNIAVVINIFCGEMDCRIIYCWKVYSPMWFQGDTPALGVKIRAGGLSRRVPPDFAGSCKTMNYGYTLFSFDSLYFAVALRSMVEVKTSSTPSTSAACKCQ